MPPITVPTGFWKVLIVIAERTPQCQLIWLAALLCAVVLGFGLLAYAGIMQAANSEPAIALANLLKR